MSQENQEERQQVNIQQNIEPLPMVQVPEGISQPPEVVGTNVGMNDVVDNNEEKKKKRPQIYASQEDSNKNVKCIEKFVQRNEAVFDYFIRKGTPLHVIHDDPLIINVDQSTNKGTQKLTLTGNCPFDFPLNAYGVEFHAGCKYKVAGASWDKNLFRGESFSSYTQDLFNQFKSGDFSINHLRLVFGKVAQKEMVFCITISVGELERPTENKRFGAKAKVYLDYFIKKELCGDLPMKQIQPTVKVVPGGMAQLPPMLPGPGMIANATGVKRKRDGDDLGDKDPKRQKVDGETEETTRTTPIESNLPMMQRIVIPPEAPINEMTQLGIPVSNFKEHPPAPMPGEIPIMPPVQLQNPMQAVFNPTQVQPPGLAIPRPPSDLQLDFRSQTGPSQDGN